MALKPPDAPTAETTYWPPPQGQWAYDDYARLPENGIRYEVITGELFMSPAPRPIHQEIILNLTLLLHPFLQKQKLGKLYFAPIDLILPGLTSIVQPDLLFIPGEKLDIVKETYIEGVPDLIIEVLSPDSLEHDRRTKFHLYAQTGVREYWLVDPDASNIEVNVLRGKVYTPLGIFTVEQTLRSEVLVGLSLPVNEIFPALPSNTEEDSS